MRAVDQWRARNTARVHPEIDYGFGWTHPEQPDTRWRVSYNPGSNEVIAVTRDGAIETLGTAASVDDLDRRLAGWEHHAEGGSIDWVRDRVDLDPDVARFHEPVHGPGVHGVLIDTHGGVHLLDRVTDVHDALNELTRDRHVVTHGHDEMSITSAGSGVNPWATVLAGTGWVVNGEALFHTRDRLPLDQRFLDRVAAIRPQPLEPSPDHDRLIADVLDRDVDNDTARDGGQHRAPDVEIDLTDNTISSASRRVVRAPAGRSWDFDL
jgi:hypothetical protein